MYFLGTIQGHLVCLYQAKEIHCSKKTKPLMFVRPPLCVDRYSPCSRITNKELRARCEIFLGSPKIKIEK